MKLYNSKECYQVQIHHGHIYKPLWKKNRQNDHMMILKEW
jgi:predicted nucleotide-binding protein (sugar kinase/HSP70/actin superfamily)